MAAAVDSLRLSHPALLDSDSDVGFSLKKQALIELIRSGDTLRAIQFAQAELAPAAASSVRSFLRSISGCFNSVFATSPPVWPNWRT